MSNPTRGFLLAALVLAGMPQAASAAGYWTRTGSMSAGRVGLTLTLLDNGEVLAEGGTIGPATSELYNPVTGLWGQVAAMSADHDSSAITRLSDGRYLLIDGSGLPNEIYDPQTNSWTLGPALVQPFGYGVAVVTLADGRVLAIGGYDPSFQSMNIELLDQAAGQWTLASDSSIPLNFGNGFPYGTLLADGRALFFNTNGFPYTEIFEPVTSQWSPAAAPIASGDFNFAGAWSSMVGAVLDDGTILSAGSCGAVDVSTRQTSACALSQKFDPASGQWTQTAPLLKGRTSHTLTTLGNGDVLAAGGAVMTYVAGKAPYQVEYVYPTETAERWSANAAKWMPAAWMPGARAFHAAVLLPNGNVLVAGGMSTFTTNLPGLFLSTAAIYHP